MKQSSFPTKFSLILMLLVFMCGCNSKSQLSPATALEPSPTIVYTDTPIPTDTTRPSVTPSPIPTDTPTVTLTPTETLTPTPSPTPLGGGSGYLMMFENLNVVKVSLHEKSDIETIVASEKITSEFGIKDISSQWTGDISLQGNIAAFWNCSTYWCDTERGLFYLFTTDFKHKTSFELPGYPYFLGWSADQDRLLAYIGSTMANDVYLIKTGDAGFGEMIRLGQFYFATWSADKQTIFAQRGGTVYEFDKDGQELRKLPCLDADACMYAPSPDGKRFASPPREIFYGLSAPKITIFNQDFTEKKILPLIESVYAGLFLRAAWLPDNLHVLLFGTSYGQFNRRYWRMDALETMNVETGEEKAIKLDLPDDFEAFMPCDLSPDGSYLIYLGHGGRIKEQGRILLTHSYAVLVPITSDHPTIERITTTIDVRDSCPTWIR
jgi:hypothetical protein